MLIMCVVLPVLCLEFIVTNLYCKEVQKMDLQKKRDAITHIRIYRKYLINEVKNYSDYIHNDQSLYDFIYKTYESPKEFGEEYLSYLNHSIFNFSKRFADKNEINIYTDNPTVVYGDNIRKMKEAYATDWYTYVKKNIDTSMAYIENTKPITIRWLIKLDSYEKRIKYNAYNAIIKVNVDVDKVNQILVDMCIPYDCYIFYKDKLILTNQDKDFIGHSYDEVSKSKNLEKVITEETANNNAWSYYMDFHEKQDSWFNIYLKSLANLYLICILILPIVLLVFFLYSIEKRIVLLKGRFDRNSELLLTPIEEDCGKDEIGRLISYYNNNLIHEAKLQEEIQRKKEEKATLEISKKQAEINALMSQANPHFLYNSIESICMRCLLKKEYETAQIMRHLSVLLRDMSSWKNDQKQLIEELDFTTRYLEIQKYRFGNKIKYTIDCDEECEDLIIPKLSVITFVENSFVHGIENSLDDGEIDIYGKKEKDVYIITISDNGAGMTKDQKDKIFDNLEHLTFETFEAASSTGIMNACLRLKLLYGERFEFSLESEIDQGTTVVIRIKEGDEGC